MNIPKSINAYAPIKHPFKSTSFKGNSNLRPIPFDIFCKTAKIENNNSKEYIKNLYREVLSTVKKQNPMFEELNIPTPEIMFANDEDFIACYSIFSNTISIDETYANEDAYILIAKNAQGDRLPMGIFPESEIEEYKKNTMDTIFDVCDFETVKATKNEKDLYLKSCIAHELRHCLQEHLCLSTEGEEELLKFKQSKILNLLAKLKEAIDYSKSLNFPHAMADSKKYLKEYQKIQKEGAYILNFKPYKVLGKDTKLKFSLVPDDNRKWSVKNHFIKASYDYNNNDRKNYRTFPTEIDAYNYQLEYIFSQDDENKCRDDAISAMLMFLYNRFDGVECLKENGYDALE